LRPLATTPRPLRLVESKLKREERKEGAKHAKKVWLKAEC